MQTSHLFFLYDHYMIFFMQLWYVVCLEKVQFLIFPYVYWWYEMGIIFLGHLWARGNICLPLLCNMSVICSIHRSRKTMDLHPKYYVSRLLMGVTASVMIIQGPHRSDSRLQWIHVKTLFPDVLFLGFFFLRTCFSSVARLCLFTPQSSV